MPTVSNATSQGSTINPNSSKARIGILAVQGAYAAHSKVLQQLGATVHWVRTAEDLTRVNALVIPGGESTVMLHHLHQQADFWPALQAFVQSHPCLGTCAGLIVLAQQVQPTQASLGVLNVTVQRNAYGRQRDSHIAMAQTSLQGGALEAVFIRAPRIIHCATDVEVLAKCDQTPVLVRQGHIIGCSFHPELGQDTRVHELLLQMI